MPARDAGRSGPSTGREGRRVIQPEQSVIFPGPRGGRAENRVFFGHKPNETGLPDGEFLDFP